MCFIVRLLYNENFPPWIRSGFVAFHRNTHLPAPRYTNVLNKHIKFIHLNHKKYACDWCEKQFRDKERLRNHITAVHDKLKLFLCEYCPYECAAILNLNRHRKNVHKATENATKNKLIDDVKNGKHPYYNEEKFQLLLVSSVWWFQKYAKILHLVNFLVRFWNNSNCIDTFTTVYY